MPELTFAVAGGSDLQIIEPILEALQRQSMEDWEAVVVVDSDRQADESVGAIEADGRIRMIFRAGPSDADVWNAAIAGGQPEWITFLAPGAMMYKGFAARLLASASDAFDAIYCRTKDVGGDGRVLLNTFDKALAHDPFRILSQQCNIVPHSIILRRERLVALGGFDAAAAPNELWDMCLRLARTGARFKGDPEVTSSVHHGKGAAPSAD